MDLRCIGKWLFHTHGEGNYMHGTVRKNEIAALVKNEIKRLNEKSRFQETKKYMQHGRVSVYEHCVRVAYTSCYLAAVLKIPVDRTALVRGALLHDYFLYDWHEKGEGHSLHGFFHPRKAWENARQDMPLSDIEKNIILRHMFPLTVVPPQFREAWLVCAADKICAMKETVSKR